MSTGTTNIVLRIPSIRTRVRSSYSARSITSTVPNRIRAAAAR